MCRLSFLKISNKIFRTALAVLLMESCMSDRTEDIRLHGHRGCRGFLPENTTEGFVYAWSKDVPVLEMDVVLSADSELIVSHDPYMHTEICAMPDGSPVLPQNQMALNIYRMQADEVKTFICGKFPHPRFPDQLQLITHKPLLSDVVSKIGSLSGATGKKMPAWNIEIKSRPEWDQLYHPEPNEYARIFLRKLSQIDFKNDVYIQSFDSRILNALHKLSPALKLVYLNEDPDKGVRTKLQELDFVPYGYSPNHALVDQSVVNYCADHKLRLFVWTVNDDAEMKRLTGMGVKDIITDFPVKEKPAPNEPALYW